MAGPPRQCHLAEPDDESLEGKTALNARHAARTTLHNTQDDAPLSLNDPTQPTCAYLVEKRIGKL